VGSRPKDPTTRAACEGRRNRRPPHKQGWDFKTGEDRDEVYEVLRAWSKQGHVKWGKAGVTVV